MVSTLTSGCGIMQGTNIWSRRRNKIFTGVGPRPITTEILHKDSVQFCSLLLALQAIRPTTLGMVFYRSSSQCFGKFSILFVDFTQHYFTELQLCHSPVVTRLSKVLKQLGINSSVWQNVQPSSNGFITSSGLIEVWSALFGLTFISELGCTNFWES